MSAAKDAIAQMKRNWVRKQEIDLRKMLERERTKAFDKSVILYASTPRC